jgi:hypothetical protein
MLETIINKVVASALVLFMPVYMGVNALQKTATTEVSTVIESSNCESFEKVFAENDDSINQNGDTTTFSTIEAVVSPTLEPTPTVAPTPKPTPSPTQSSVVDNSGFGIFKSWTNYKVLNRNSKQWQIQKQAYTDENGLRKIDEYYLCAIGTGWGIKLGEKAIIHLSNGNSFNIIMCDIKDDRHTDSATHTYTKRNGCVVEFYVEESKLLRSAKIHGTISKIDFFNASVVNIEKL